MKFNWIKYVVVISAFLFIIIGGLSSITIIEKIGSQKVAQVACQQFNENTNAYAEISLNTGIKKTVLLVIEIIMFVNSICFVFTLISFIRKDYILFLKDGKNEEN